MVSPTENDSSWPTDKAHNPRVKCLECDSNKKAWYGHQLAPHLKSAHDMTVEQYQSRFPEAPLISELTKKALAEARSKIKSPGIPAAKEEKPKMAEEPVYFFGKATVKGRIPDSLTEEDKKLIPVHDPNFVLDDKVLELLAMAIQHNDNVMIVGPTGSGKSALVKELAALLDQPLRRVNLHGDVRSADFVGEKVVEVDEQSGQAVVMWRDGVLPDAMINGHWLLLDELDAMPPSIAFVLQAVLENNGPRQLVLTADNGRVVQANERFRIIATANTLGKGDDSGLYTGTNVMNEAFLDRFGTVINHYYLEQDKERQLLVEKTDIEPSQAKFMVEVATFVRRGLDKEECACTFSTRRLLNWAQKTVALRGDKSKPEKAGESAHWRAAEITVLNKLGEDDRKYVEGIIQRVMGGKPSTK